MKHKHMLRVEIGLANLSQLLGLPGQVVRAKYDDRKDCIALVLEGEQFPEVCEGEMILTQIPVFSAISARELLDLSRGELAEMNLKGAKITHTQLGLC